MKTLGQKAYESLLAKSPEMPTWDALDETIRQAYEDAVAEAIHGVSVGIQDNGSHKVGTVRQVTPINLTILVGGS